MKDEVENEWREMQKMKAEKKTEKWIEGEEAIGG
jgi:hypothetical protein